MNARLRARIGRVCDATVAAAHRGAEAVERAATTVMRHLPAADRTPPDPGQPGWDADAVSSAMARASQLLADAAVVPPAPPPLPPLMSEASADDVERQWVLTPLDALVQGDHAKINRRVYLVLDRHLVTRATCSHETYTELHLHLRDLATGEEDAWQPADPGQRILAEPHIPDDPSGLDDPGCPAVAQ